MRDNEQIATYLELVAAQAKSLANDLKHARLWGGELTRGLGAIREALDKAQNLARDDR